MDLTTPERFKQLSVCVIVPTYNNERTLAHVLENVFRYTNDVIVVNDGSTDSTASIIARFPAVSLVSYPQNQGKGWALRRAFGKARELGFQYAISIDSDGQHFPEDFPLFLDELERKPGCLIIGKRNMEQAGIPGKSSFGNKFSNFWFWVETGYKMEDTQSGYRLYPVAALRSKTFFTRKFEFEIEVIVRAAWSGIPITAVPVKIHYDEKDKRISHFRPFRDFTRISVLNTVLVTIALLYIKPRDLLRNPARFGRILRDELFNPGDSNSKKAISVGFGVFMGIVPIWGFQLIVAIGMSVLLKLNKGLVIVAANISIPPFIPFILFASHWMGKMYMGERATTISFDKSITLQHVQDSLTQYILGAITLSIVGGLAAGLFTYLTLSLKKKPVQA